MKADRKDPSPADDAGRQSLLAARRNLKMARSPHAYVRGNTARFYEWLAESSAARVCVGPPVWICGDCHVGNLGPMADAQGKVSIQIRDLDQAVIGNPSHDLIRLGLSLATVARSSSLPGIMTARMLEALTAGYIKGLLSAKPIDTDIAPSIHIVFRESLRRKWRDLARERIDDRKHSIPRGAHFWSIGEVRQRQLQALVEAPPTRRLVAALTHREEDDAMTFRDAAFWVKGCSSLGLRRYAVLMEVGDGDLSRQGACLLDVKEATRAVAPAAAGVRMPRDPASRVAMAARALSPLLGARMSTGKVGRHSVFIHELLPQDLKIDIDEVSADEATAVALLLSSVVGQAHARQLDRETARAWARTLRNAQGKTLAAPSWLWTTVVEQLSRHEAAYLEHCRRYARLAA